MSTITISPSGQNITASSSGIIPTLTLVPALANNNITATVLEQDPVSILAAASGHNVSVSVADSSGIVTLVENSASTSIVTINQGQQGPAGVSIHYVHNYGNDRVITSDGTPSGLFAESNLSFSGSTLTVNSTIIAISGAFTSSISGALLNIDNIQINNNTISSINTNGSIDITPNGTGDVNINADTIRIGDQNINCVLTTYGTGDITFNTNNGTNSSSLTINDGINGNISASLNGTGLFLVNSIPVSLSGHTHLSSDIIDFGSSFSGLLPTISNSGNNRILTSTGTTTGINAESNLTFDGSILFISGETIVDNLKLDGNTLSSLSGNIIINPSGSGALQRDSGGNSRGQYSIDWQTARTANTQIAKANYSVIGGGQNNTVGSYGNHSVIVGGQANLTNGSYSTIGGGNSNEAQGYYSFVGGGYNNTANNSNTVVCGGSSNSVVGSNSLIIGGSNNVVSGDYSAIIGGTNNNDGDYNNVFILGSNLTATQANTTYTQNLIAQSGRFTALSVNNTGVSLIGHSHLSSDITDISGYVSSGVNIYLSSLSSITDPCDVEYVLIQNISNNTKLINISNLAKSISVIDGGGVLYSGC